MNKEPKISIVMPPTVNRMLKDMGFMAGWYDPHFKLPRPHSIHALSGPAITAAAATIGTRKAIDNAINSVLNLGYLDLIKLTNWEKILIASIGLDVGASVMRIFSLLPRLRYPLFGLSWLLKLVQLYGLAAIPALTSSGGLQRDSPHHVRLQIERKSAACSWHNGRQCALAELNPVRQ